MPPLQLGMATFGVVDDSEDIVDSDETDVVDPAEGDLVLSFNVHRTQLL